ncbi:MAG: DUF255 domain-containing protein [Phycisphaeraceae bacterium]|nr:DUF255 domain-containing protein [Phycisphaeraceae bacterium]
MSGRAAQPRENRLAKETSPYLLQHARNPVDWYPWGDGAIAAARERGVPIFLSVGYSTCYWCHVMERESFEDEATAAVMNERFVCVKVDREERPDVDDIYMNAVQVLTGRGGWPMSVFLEPGSLRPFFAGTYFPPEDRHGLPSFRRVLVGMSDAWKQKRGEVIEQAESVARAVRENLAAAAAPRQIGREQVAQGVSMLLRMHDPVNGGFGGGGDGGGGPKFPQPSYPEFLLAFRGFAGDEATRNAVDAAVRLTLDKMAIGGMNDQVGGGFHRYSVDGRWIVPHFEKMLYDNGQLAEVYARAAREYGDGFYRRIVRRTLDYVLREMTSPDGAFCSAQDAEVNHREGQNYLWTMEQMAAVLGEEDAAFAARVYGVSRGANFKDPHHQDEPASSVLYLVDRPERVAESLGMTEAALLERLDAVNGRLYAARARRDQPSRDDKVLAGWNGLMIAGMAVGGSVLEDRRYIDAGARAADAVLRLLVVEMDGEPTLMRSYRAGTAKIPAFLDDYAYVIHGLIELHRAGHDERERYLREAVALTKRAGELFGDSDRGGYFDTRAGQGDLFVRARSTYDGAVPSGVSVMLHNLLDLHEILGGTEYLDAAAGCMASVSAAAAQSSVGSVNSTRALLRMLTAPGTAAALQAALNGAETAKAAAGGAPDGAVEVLAAVERLAVGEGHEGAAGTVLKLRVAEGYHVTAADPGPGGKDLIPLRVFMVGGSGYAVYADYPEGAPYGPNGDLRVYRGEVTLPIVIERTGEVTGRPLIAVRYQACTETECLVPVAVELDIAIDRQ